MLCSLYRTYNEHLRKATTVLDWLLLDMNSFFASCEQQANPALRNRPVAVVPVTGTDTTCVIAASHQAKKHGVKTGTLVGEARKLCPGIVFVKGSAGLYRRIHEKVIEAAETCLHVDHIMSIDEMACRLIGDEREKANAIVLANKVKAAVRAHAGECLTCSVGLGPNRFWAKVASDMQKPDGLVVVEPHDIPVVIHQLELRDLIGVGRGMEARLNKAGVFTTTQLWHLTKGEVRRIWGGIEGDKFYDRLRGVEIGYESTSTRSVGHQHVLEPYLRNHHGSWTVARDLLSKAAERMRKYGFYATRLSVQIKLTRQQGYWEHAERFTETQDTLALIAILQSFWARLPHNIPALRLSVVLSGFVPAEKHQADLWTHQQEPKRDALMAAVDRINDRHGRKALKFGHQELSPIHAKETKIAFHRVPELWEYEQSEVGGG